MQKVISFSLWGSNPKYYIGAIRNTELAKQLYPDYKLKFYVDILIPRGILIQLEDMGAEIEEMGEIGDFKGMFWRFDAVNKYDIVLVRDADSRLNEREKCFVDKWLDSDKLFHTIKDHPYHQFSVMPGLMGFKKCNVDFEYFIKSFSKEDKYGIDYVFWNKVFGLIQKDLLVHDTVFGNIEEYSDCVRAKENYCYFCGEIYNENEEFVIEHRRVLEKWLKSVSK